MSSLSTDLLREEVVPPEPAAMIESLRSIGYSLEAAIADIVDNSIAAGCRHVVIDFDWDGERSSVCIADDGLGMDATQIVKAMRLGSRAPGERRSEGDLGRFGLGLKTASFSQCRDLTVYSRRAGGKVVSRRWDLNHVVARREWVLLQGTESAPERLLEQRPSGTIVVWQQLDNLVPRGVSANDPKAQARFLERIASVEAHLSAVFARFLDATPGVSVTINGAAVSGWDPFLIDHQATQWLASETISMGGSKLTVQPYVLPHSSKLSDGEMRSAAGTRGWNAHQGFYVYRSGRLLVDGSWLGLGVRKDEHYRLARIAIDLPTDLDLQWRIDVKKSVARPPDLLREDLARIARITRERAVEIYRHRGKVISREQRAEFVYAWRQVKSSGRVSYRINRSHPLFEDALRGIDGAQRDALDSLLCLLEQTIPAQYITIQGAEDPDAHMNPYEGEPGAAVRATARRIFDVMRSQGMSPREAGRRLRLMEPFCYFAEVVAEMEREA